MVSVTRRALVATLAVAVPTAGAATIPGQTVDGPSASIVRIGGMDVAPDGTAAVAYVKKVAAVDHVFVARFDGASWSTPVRVDTGNDATPSHNVAVAVAGGGRTLVTWINGATDGTANAAISPAGGQPFTAGAITGGATHKDVRIDMNEEGIAYAALTSQGGGGSDVRAFRLSGAAWSPVQVQGAVTPTVFDKTEADGAGGSGSQNWPGIGVTPDGNAVIAFPEEVGAGSTDVFVSRITGTSASAVQAADIPALGAALSSNSTDDMVVVDVESNTRAWIAFRQAFTYGASQRPRILLRPLDGAGLGPAQAPDGLGDSPTEGAEFPSIAVNPAGAGLLATPRQLTSQAWAGGLAAGTWATAARLDTEPASNTPPRPIAAIGDDGSGLVAWQHQAAVGGSIEVRARVRLAGGVFGETLTLSDPALGAVATGDPSIAAGVDKNGRGLIAWAQGPATAVRIMVARTDGPPVPPVATPAPTPAPTPTSPIRGAPSLNVISALTVRPRAFRALRSGGPFARAGGALLAFTATVEGTTTLRIERRLAGRRGRTGACVALRPTLRAARPCVRWSFVAAISLATRPGPNSVRLSGRARGSRLPPGVYRLTVGGVRSHFTVVA